MTWFSSSRPLSTVPGVSKVFVYSVCLECPECLGCVQLLRYNVSVSTILSCLKCPESLRVLDVPLECLRWSRNSGESGEYALITTPGVLECLRCLSCPQRPHDPQSRICSQVSCVFSVSLSQNHSLSIMAQAAEAGIDNPTCPAPFCQKSEDVRVFNPAAATTSLGGVYTVGRSHISRVSRVSRVAKPV